VTEWTLVAPWPKPPLSMNQRRHWAPKARDVATCRSWAAWAARAARIPSLTHTTVELVWYVPDKRRRDEDNATETLKPLCDGLVDAGVVPDDTPQWMTKLMPRIEYRRGAGGVELLVTGERRAL
jgi:crossover junction endodeoxyribonuclease RusA